MRKFKHIKTGLIVELDSNGDYKFSNNENSKYIIPKFIIECISEWQEIIEKDYEILSFTPKENMYMFPKGSILTKDYNGILSTNLSFEDYYLQRLDNFNIHSVKRLSNGEIFTIGDKINTHENVNEKIESIDISDCNDGIYLDTKYYKGLPLDKWKHSKKSLFITEDGIKIFEEDTFVCVSLVKIFESTMDTEVEMEPYDIWENCKYYSLITNKTGNFKAFSTKQAAEEYILMNKSVLSLNDIFNTITWLDNSKKTLKELVKSKLNK